jgi:hypothetical protein
MEKRRAKFAIGKRRISILKVLRDNPDLGASSRMNNLAQNQNGCPCTSSDDSVQGTERMSESISSLSMFSDVVLANRTPASGSL